MFRKMIFAAISLVSFALPLHAGQATDRFSICLVKSTTQADNLALVKWVASFIGEHPSLSDYIHVSRLEQQALDKNTAAIMTRLITLDCKTEAYEAVVLDGDVAFGAAFEVLGGVAMQALMGHEAVALASEGFINYLDMKDFEFLE